MAIVPEQPEIVASYGTGKTGFIDTMAGNNVEGVADAVHPQEPNFFASSGNVEGAEKGAVDDQDPVVIIQDESKLESMTDKTTDALTTENLSQEQLQLQAQ